MGGQYLPHWEPQHTAIHCQPTGGCKATRWFTLVLFLPTSSNISHIACLLLLLSLSLFIPLLPSFVLYPSFVPHTTTTHFRGRGWNRYIRCKLMISTTTTWQGTFFLKALMRWNVVLGEFCFFIFKICDEKQYKPVCNEEYSQHREHEEVMHV